VIAPTVSHAKPQLIFMPSLTEEDALRAYARMMNTLSAEHIAPLLSDDFRYASQWVFDEIESPEAFLEYIGTKLDSIRNSNAQVWAEMGTCPRDCVVMSQGTREDLVATVLAEVKAGKIVRFDMCCVPPPESATRTGEFPD
jgi:hypothetical protein